MILGAAVKISTTTVAAATSATIAIRNPDGSAAMTAGTAMTDDSGGLFSFIYQSTAGDPHGTYKADVTAALGGFFDVERVRFQLED